MAIAPFAPAVTGVHLQNLDSYDSERFVVIVARHPVVESPLYVVLVSHLTCSFVRPAAQWRFFEIIVQTIITVLRTLPGHHERDLATRCSLINNTQHGLDP